MSYVLIVVVMHFDCLELSIAALHPSRYHESYNVLGDLFGG